MKQALTIMIMLMLSLVSPLALAAENMDSGKGPASAEFLSGAGIPVMDNGELNAAADMNAQLHAITCDEIHSPIVAFEVSKGQEPDDEPGFIVDLVTAGYFVGTIDISDPDQVDDLNDCVDVLIITSLKDNLHPTGPYSDAEAATLKAWAEAGGGLIVNSEWGPTFNVYAEEILNEFGIFSAGMVTDPTDFDTNTYWVIYQNADNMAAHPITAGVETAEMIAGSYFRTDSAALTPLIWTDEDADPAEAAVAYAGEVRNGCVAIFDDTNWIQDVSGLDGYHKEHNWHMAMNAVDWASQCGEPVIPEFGLLAGGIAVIGAIGGFFLLRKSK